MDVQIIRKDDEPEWAVIPYDEYLQLVEAAELLQDIQDYDSAKAVLDRGDEELIPSEVINALLNGENPLKVWREYRGMTQTELSEKVNISVLYLSQLETEKRKGSAEVLAAITQALGVTLDDIIPPRN